LAAVRANPRLRRIGWANLTWNVFAGSAPTGARPGGVVR
jgi:hypothetical protein